MAYRAEGLKGVRVKRSGFKGAGLEGGGVASASHVFTSLGSPADEYLGPRTS